ncbi:nuclear transport factor 2 family protein [Phyllobacterium sp. P5_D12]
MSNTYRKFFNRRAKLIASVVGVGLWLTLAAIGESFAVGCENGPGIVWPPNLADAPVTDEREILKLIHRFHWALDDHKTMQLEGLFADNVTYELCDAVGDQLQKTTGKDQLGVYLKTYFNELTFRGTQTRHIASNTLLNFVGAGNIQAKTTVVVTLQHPDIETPVLDYTAVLRSVFTTDGTIWKFSQLTLILDGPKLELRAR